MEKEIERCADVFLLFTKKDKSTAKATKEEIGGWEMTLVLRG